MTGIIPAASASILCAAMSARHQDVSAARCKKNTQSLYKV